MISTYCSHGLRLFILDRWLQRPQQNQSSARHDVDASAGRGLESHTTIDTTGQSGLTLGRTMFRGLLRGSIPTYRTIISRRPRHDSPRLRCRSSRTARGCSEASRVSLTGTDSTLCTCILSHCVFEHRVLDKSPEHSGLYGPIQPCSSHVDRLDDLLQQSAILHACCCRRSILIANTACLALTKVAPAAFWPWLGACMRFTEAQHIARALPGLRPTLNKRRSSRPSILANAAMS